ncbi:hypothetical protein D7X30_40680 [Corallococcus sp. AB011P]|uniref:hypothetical protein n=1 Tax=Corallococcus sp. AB011P TaxID=2316735 RepID=UPI000EA19438|nr:hypothetical protein [Corallococcus sp. AB011P]RKG48489.1 hypothetical protein D7X30_40680 [Corallococcus sp. AB011P]
MNVALRPAGATAFFDHLATWGEVSKDELRDLRAEGWATALVEAGVLEEVHDDGADAVAWHFAAGFVFLLDRDSIKVARRACFAVPAYRAYLVGILAEGLIDAARASMTSELEEWTKGDLAPLLTEVNRLLDGLESQGRLVDSSPPDLDARMASLPGRDGSFASWDQFLLGQSGRPKTLFDFVLRRFAPSSQPAQRVDDPAAVLRPLPLSREDGFDLGSASLPAPWNTRRRGIFSGIALIDEHGRRLFDEDRPLTEVLPDLIRDAIVEHPFYAVVVHLAICAWRSPAASIPTIELFVPASGALHDASVLVGSRDTGRLADLLGDLVRAQGFAPFGLRDGKVSDELMTNLLRNLIEVGILRRQDELLVLDEQYQASLMASRLRTVFRPGKQVQTRIVAELGARVANGGQP